MCQLVTWNRKTKKEVITTRPTTFDRFLPTHSHNDDTESEEDDDNQMEADNHMDSTESTSQSVMSPQNDPSLPGSKTDREVAMEKVHKNILPKVLFKIPWMEEGV